MSPYNITEQITYFQHTVAQNKLSHLNKEERGHSKKKGKAMQEKKSTFIMETFAAPYLVFGAYDEIIWTLKDLGSSATPVLCAFTMRTL